MGKTEIKKQKYAKRTINVKAKYSEDAYRRWGKKGGNLLLKIQSPEYQAEIVKRMDAIEEALDNLTKQYLDYLDSKPDAVNPHRAFGFISGLLKLPARTKIMVVHPEGYTTEQIEPPSNT